jgi:hypothetical protein
LLSDHFRTCSLQLIFGLSDRKFQVFPTNEPIASCFVVSPCYQDSIDCTQHSLRLVTQCRWHFYKSCFRKCLGCLDGNLTEPTGLISWITRISTLQVRCRLITSARYAIIYFETRSSLFLVDIASVTVAIWKILGKLKLFFAILRSC